MSSKMSKVEGMKTKPAGGANRQPFGQNVMPTNAGMVKKLGSMLSAIKHIGRSASGSNPFTN